MPLFHPYASEQNGKLFDANRLRLWVENAYGLRLTTDIIEFIVPRMVKANLLKALDRQKETYIWTSSDDKRATEEASVNSKIELLESELQSFIKDFPSLTKLSIDLDVALDLLFDWLLSHDEGVASAHKVISRAEDETDTESKNRIKKTFKAEEQYLFARFVENLKESNESLYDYLSEITNAILVSEVVLDFQQPEPIITSGPKPVIYLDAPLCMDLLGLTGKARSENSTYIVEGLRSLGLSVVTFSHCVEEIDRNLSALLRNRVQDRTGPTADAIRKREVEGEYVKLVSENPEHFLKEKNIQVYDSTKIPMQQKDQELFTEENEQYLFSKLQSHYSSVEALERDIQSISLVIKRRSGQSSKDFFSAKHVFITRNGLLTVVCYSYCKDISIIRKNEISPAMHQRRVAALLWLVSDNQTRAEISRKELIVNCSTALKSNPDAIQSMRDTLSRINPGNVDQFDAMMSQPRPYQVAMDLSLGQANVVNEDNIEEVYKRLEESVVERESKKHKEELQGVKRDLNEKIKSGNDRYTDLEGKYSGAKQKLKEHQELSMNLFVQEFKRLHKRIDILYNAFGICLVALVIVSSFIASEVAVFQSNSIYLNYLPHFLGAIIAVFSIYVWFWQRKPSFVRNLIVDWVQEEFLQED